MSKRTAGQHQDDGYVVVVVVVVVGFGFFEVVFGSDCHSVT